MGHREWRYAPERGNRQHSPSRGLIVPLRGTMSQRAALALLRDARIRALPARCLDGPAIEVFGSERIVNLARALLFGI